MTDDKTYTPAEAAKELGVSRKWLYVLCQRGEIATIRFQTYGRIRIPASEIQKAKTPKRGQ